MKEKLTLKQKKFVTETAKTLNPTEGAMRSYNVKKRETAREIAKENLMKPYIKKALTDLLEEKASKEDVLNVLYRNIAQNKNISASNQAIDIRFKLSGDYAPQKHINITANLTPQQRSERIQTILQELEAIRATANKEIAPPRIVEGTGLEGGDMNK